MQTAILANINYNVSFIVVRKSSKSYQDCQFVERDFLCEHAV